jgi:hypothetical protein
MILFPDFNINVEFGEFGVKLDWEDCPPCGRMERRLVI